MSFAAVWPSRPSLRAHVAWLWAARSQVAAPLLPDGAVELVWSGRGLFVRGADTQPHSVDAFPEQTFVALRFRPGAAAAILGLHGRELTDARIGISQLWGVAEMERLEAALASCHSPLAAATVLEDAVAVRVRQPPDRVVVAVVRAFERQRAPARVSRLADELGLSERQLLRRCVASLGYGPKTLDRILRFQRFRALAVAGEHSLADLAIMAGYADQAHLTRECLRLAGETPAVHCGRI